MTAPFPEGPVRSRRTAVSAGYVFEDWPAEMGAPADLSGPPERTRSDVRPDVESPPSEWAPLRPAASTVPAGSVVFVDGVRRLDARVWVPEASGRPTLGLCGSYAAGSVRCDGRTARIDAARVERVLLAPSETPALDCGTHRYEPWKVSEGSDETLRAELQVRMRHLEVSIANAAPDADLFVLDGPLRGRESLVSAVGYVKTQAVEYLPPALGEVIARLETAQRTPLFQIAAESTGSRRRYSWYTRLPMPPTAPRHAWSGIVRLEVAADLGLVAARRLADVTVVTLPRFASVPHKDPRAPQNLHPVAGLERALRRRLGDRELVKRQLRTSALVG